MFCEGITTLEDMGISSAVIGRIADDVILPGKEATFTFLNKTL